MKNVKLFLHKQKIIRIIKKHLSEEKTLKIKTHFVINKWKIREVDFFYFFKDAPYLIPSINPFFDI